MNTPLAKFIAERRSIAEAATPGPWEHELEDVMNAYGIITAENDPSDDLTLNLTGPLNGPFIVDARNCMPTLLQIVEMQDAALDMAMEYCEDRIVWDDLNEARAAVEALLKEKL